MSELISRPQTMVAGRPQLGLILANNGVITDDELDSAVRFRVSAPPRMLYGRMWATLEYGE